PLPAPEHRTGLLGGFLEGHRAGDLKRHFAGIHVVVAAVVEEDLHILNRISRQDTALQGFLNALIDWLDVFLGNRTTHNLVDELVALAGLVWLEANFHVTILAPAA